MATLHDIEKSISNLSPEALAEFRAWFEAFDANAWDRQMENDAKAGKLDRLANEAL